MPTCDYCPRELGNAGAKTQHERSCDKNPANQQDAEPAAAEPVREAQTQQPQQRQQTRQPVNPSKQAQRQMQAVQQTEEPQAQTPQPVEQAPQQAGEIQTPEQASAAQQIGQAGAELMTNLDANDPETRAQATSMATEAAAEGIKYLGKKKAQEILGGHNRAKQGAGQTANPVEDVIDCGNCGKPIDSVPASDRFRCPHCKVTLMNPL